MPGAYSLASYSLYHFKLDQPYDVVVVGQNPFPASTSTSWQLITTNGFPFNECIVAVYRSVAGDGPVNALIATMTANNGGVNPVIEHKLCPGGYARNTPVLINPYLNYPNYFNDLFPGRSAWVAF
jgi:hypothetical protein